MSFHQTTRDWFNKLSQQIFSQLKADERMNLNLRAEDSTFVRFNQSKVRQNTYVDQKVLEVQVQNASKQMTFETTLTGTLDQDYKTLLSLLNRCREEFKALPDDPYLIKFENRGNSDNTFTGKIPSVDELVKTSQEIFKDSDMAGLYSAGPLVRASCNSLGQSHWFSTETSFFDYSIFCFNESGDPKATKGVYSDRNWDFKKFADKVTHTKSFVPLLQRKNKELSPGKYRTYFSPSAYSVMWNMLSWNGLGIGSYKKGACALAKLGDGHKKLSPLITLKENFGLGASPQFNSIGEIAPTSLTLIENGELKNWLVGPREAQEYGVPSNGAETSMWGSNYLRSPELTNGSLNEKNALKELGTGIYLQQLHYLNWSDPVHARITGMTRYACFWVENGEIRSPIRDMRFDETLYHSMGEGLLGLSQQTEFEPNIDTYLERKPGVTSSPGALVDAFSFTL